MAMESLYPVCRHGAGRHILHVAKWGSEGVPIFCVHALTRTGGDFEDFAKALAPRAVFAADMAGRGGSPWLLDSSLYTYAHYVEDCLQLLDALQLKQVDWVGTSLGGLIGMSLAAHHPARIRKLVLNDVGPFLPLAGLQRIGSYVGQDPRFADLEQAYRYCRTIYAGFGMVEDEKYWRAFAARSVKQNKDGSTRLHYDPRLAHVFHAVQGDVDLWPVYEMITCPTLVLRGAYSDVLLEKDAKAMTERGPRAQLITFEDCGHAPSLAEEKQIRAVTEFLSG